MTILWARESIKDRTISGKNKEGSVYRRSFFVRTDSPTESQADIVNECGVEFGDAHPDDPACVLNSFDCKPADDVGLLYLVSFEYGKPTLEDQQENQNPGAGGPNLIPTWSGSSSVTTGPVFKTWDGNMILNSAGDPLEGLEMEKAEFRLTLTQYYASHTWRGDAAFYTNRTNDAAWNGGDAGTWKCQGCSARLNMDNSGGAVLVYWEVTWEFAYRDGGWDLRPWDVGFAERVDAQGNPSSQGVKRKNIVGQDGKPVRQPVGLCGGVAVAVGQPPCELFFMVYKRADFAAKFGQVFTPTFG